MARGKLSLNHLEQLQEISAEVKAFLRTGRYTRESLKELREKISFIVDTLPSNMAVYINSFVMEYLLDLCDASIEIDFPRIGETISELSIEQIKEYHKAIITLCSDEALADIIAQAHYVLSAWEEYEMDKLIPLLNA